MYYYSIGISFLEIKGDFGKRSPLTDYFNAVSMISAA